MVQALKMRHMVEQMCTDVLRRFARALGPAPFVKDADVSRRYAELDLFYKTVPCRAQFGIAWTCTPSGHLAAAGRLEIPKRGTPDGSTAGSESE